MQNTTQSNKFIFILFNAGRRGELTDDCRLRIDAGKQLLGQLCYVGRDTKIMKKYFGNIHIEELNNCHDTVGNIREIKQFIEDKNNGKENLTEATIVSNFYHLRRIELILNKFNLPAKLISAEEILKKRKKIDLFEPLRLIYTMIRIKFFYARVD